MTTLTELKALADQYYDYREIGRDDFRALIAAVEALKALAAAEWMVTHDWGGDRPSVLEQARAALAKLGE